MLSLFFTALVGITCVYGLLNLCWKKWTQNLSFIPGPPTIPIFGSALILEYDVHKLFKQMQGYSQKYDHLYLLWIAHKPVIISSCLAYSEAILRSQDMLTKSSLYWFLHEWLGTGLLTSSGKKWKSRRRAITPSFHFGILKGFVSIFEEHSKRLVEKLKLKADTGEAVDIQVPVSLATLDAISETSMGVKIHAQDSGNTEYVKAVNSMNFQLNVRQKSPWLWPQLTYPYTFSGKKFYKNLKILKDFTLGVINNRIESRKSGQHKKCSETQNEISAQKVFFLDMLLDAYDKGEIDADGIREEVDTFMFEGHDTTAAGISWTLYLISRHPEVQEKLHAEIDNAPDTDNIEDKIRNMKYLESIIKESLRLHPPVPLFGRILEEDTRIEEHVIPKGTELGIDVVSLHTNPEYWDHPLSFDPERFYDEKFAKRNPYVYVPFSAGSRNCIGQKFAMLELKIMVYYVMSNFQIKSMQAEKDVQECIDIIHKSMNGLHIQFCSRRSV